MAIWKHTPTNYIERKFGYVDLRCPFCDSAMDSIYKFADMRLGNPDNAGIIVHRPSEYTVYKLTLYELLSCFTCGWWYAIFLDEGIGQTGVHVGYGTLKQFDLGRAAEPIEEIRKYLTAKYDARNQLHPKKMEELVGAIFRDSKFDKYDVQVTPYRNDEGIDLMIFNGSDNSTVGVQVKRYKGKVDISEIREFVGSLYLKGIQSGVFVTTGEFTSGASKVADLSAAKGLPVELIDNNDLFRLMKISAIPQYKDIHEFREEHGLIETIPTKLCDYFI